MMCIYIALIGAGAHAAAEWDIGDAMYCKNYFYIIIHILDFLGFGNLAFASASNLNFSINLACILLSCILCIVLLAAACGSIIGPTGVLF